MLRYGADPYAVNNAMVTTFKMARDEGVLGLLQFTGTESCSSSSGGSMSSSPPESANEHSSPIYIAPDACIIESRDVAEEEVNGIELTVRTSPQDSPNQHAPQATISSSSSSSSSGLITPLSNANGVEISVSSVDRTEGGSSSSGGGGGVIGFIRKYTRQVVTVGVVALVGLTMVALISFNPKGLIRKAAGDRSYSVDSKQKIPSVADAQKTSLVLRGGSICVLVFSLAFGTTAFVRCKKSVELFVFNIVLAALTVYQIIAIILM